MWNFVAIVAVVSVVAVGVLNCAIAARISVRTRIIFSSSFARIKLNSCATALFYALLMLMLKSGSYVVAIQVFSCSHRLS